MESVSIRLLIHRQCVFGSTVSLENASVGKSSSVGSSMKRHLLLFTVTSGMEPKLAFLPSSPQSVLLVRQRIKASFVLSENPQHARIHFFKCAHSDAALPGRKPRKRKHKEKSAPSSESNHHGHNWNQNDAISIWQYRSNSRTQSVVSFARYVRLMWKESLCLYLIFVRLYMSPTPMVIAFICSVFSWTIPVSCTRS